MTNASLLTEEIYLDLKRLGVDEFSISLDFPDERHDANRVLPGLYAHLQDLIPKLAAHGNRDITLISVIRADNLDDLPALAEHAVRWNVAINFTAYTSLRTNDPSKSVRGAEPLALLRRQIDSLIQIKRRHREDLHGRVGPEPILRVLRARFESPAVPRRDPLPRRQSRRTPRAVRHAAGRLRHARRARPLLLPLQHMRRMPRQPAREHGADGLPDGGGRMAIAPADPGGKEERLPVSLSRPRVPEGEP